MGLNTDIKLTKNIRERSEADPQDVGLYEELMTMTLDIADVDYELSHNQSKYLRERLPKVLKECELKDVPRVYDTYRKAMLFDAPYDFDTYIQYLEIDREPKEKFYLPRRRILKRVADGLQDLTDDRLDELFLSMPPRVGKTTMLMFYVTWIIGRNPESSNLYSAYSDTITTALYQGVLEIITDPVTYKWAEVFPESPIASTNAKEETLNIKRKKRYPSLTARSLYGTLNGACDCNGVLINDDLIGGIEEALNPERLVSAWSKVENNLLTRAKENAKVIWCGTRWSLYDPIGKRRSLLETDDKFKNRRVRDIILPAFNEAGESQFNYDYDVGFTTEYYEQKRASFEHNNDMASWNAQYMQSPIEREGTLFEPAGFRYYNGVLPDEAPDRIFTHTDPAWGGGDYTATPICYQYGDDVYVHDVVFCNDDKSITEPMLADKIVKNGVKVAQFECNKMTESYAHEVSDILKKRDYRCTIRTKVASNKQSKEQRIYDKAPDIREHFIFRDDTCRDKMYQAFMQNVYSFSITGHNKHDDAPDALAGAADMILTISYKPEAIKRPF